MQDRQAELIYHPRELLSLQGVDRVLCVAPHPDDEVLGCGGLLAAWAEAGCQVHTVILTCGQQGAEQQQGDADPGLPARRREESLAAAVALGVTQPTFLEFQDRALRCDRALLAALSDAVARHQPQVLLLPSLSEPHPDHQATALAGLAAARAAGPGLHSVLFYEAGAPLHANVHFPIDAVAERKWRALRCFTSQLQVEAYEAHAQAMATLRAFGLRPPCRQAESFFRVDLQAVRDHGALAALPQWPWVRERLALANDPAQLPLVSVLVRSMNRACLPEALASVVLQTYPHWELVIVNASASTHRPLDFLPAQVPRRVVEAAGSAPCGRAQAANLALAAAQGSLALFLDDDDLLEPQHLDRLVAALQDQPRAVGAYAGVRVETHDGVHLRDYDLPWSRARLEGANFLPIHAVLFRMEAVRQRGLRFDEQWPVLEDWHFWLQLTQGADLVHCPGVSAVYRQGLGQSALGDAQHPHHWRVWHRRLLQGWASNTPADALADTLAWHALELDRTQLEADRQASQHLSDLAQLAQLRAQDEQSLRALESALGQAQALQADAEAARQALQHQLELFSRESQAALAAKEAALQLAAAQSAADLDAKEAALQMTAAESARLLAEREAQAQRFAAQAQADLDAKEAALQLAAAESARLLAEREAQMQQLAAQAQRDLDALQGQLQAHAADQARLLQAKEQELQRYAAEVRRLLDAKEAELQRCAAQAQAALQARDQAFSQMQQQLQEQIAQLQAQALTREAELQAELQAVLSSRSWRWTAPLRRRGSGR